MPEFHKHIRREVPLVSFVMQVLGLATPLLTQVVIDTVVVQHTLSMRTVVGVGLAIAVLFSAAFGWLLQYQVIHTGNRTGAVLGSHVLRHLMACRCPTSATVPPARRWRGRAAWKRSANSSPAASPPCCRICPSWGRCWR